MGLFSIIYLHFSACMITVSIIMPVITDSTTKPIGLLLELCGKPKGGNLLQYLCIQLPYLGVL